MKSEPGAYDIGDLERDGRTAWNGVRNYQARNFMRDDMRVGDLVLFYHSNAEPSGVAGIARIRRAGYPERDAWCQVDLEFVERFPRLVSLQEIQSCPALKGMLVAKRGTRLSVQPVDKAHFERLRALGRLRPSAPPAAAP